MSERRRADMVRHAFELYNRRDLDTFRPGGWVLRFRDGLISEIHTFGDPAEPRREAERT